MKGKEIMTRQIKRYSKEFQEEAIQLGLRSKSIDQAARDLGIPISTLHEWILQLSKKQHPADIQDAKALHEELKQLRKELARVKEERDIFKKKPQRTLRRKASEVRVHSSTSLSLL